MQIETAMTGQLSRYLDLAVNSAKLTAQNMANVDTPGYAAVGLDFESEMQAAMANPAVPVAPHVVHEQGLIARPDGNNVSMDRESLNLAEAQLKFRTGVTLLHTQYQMMMDAIHADGK